MSRRYASRAVFRRGLHSQPPAFLLSICRDDVRDVIVLADGDEAGKAAARGAALRWKREGRRVRIAHAPEGMDFNDMLLGCARN